MRFTLAALTLVLASFPAAQAAQILYGINSTTLITINPTTGAGALVGNQNYGDFPFGLADYNGKLYTLNQSTDEILELSTANGSTVNSVGVGVNVTGEGSMAFNSAGTLLFSVSSGGLGALYSSTLNGSSTLINSAMNPSLDGLDFAPGGTLYGISQSSGGIISLYTIDPGNGNTTLVGDTGINAATDPVAGFAIRSDGAMFAAVGRSLYSIDAGTGAGTFIGVTGYDKISGLTFLEEGGGQVPEPSTWALMLSGLAGLAFRKLRRK